MRKRSTKLGVLVASLATVLAGGSPAQAAEEPTNVARRAMATSWLGSLPALPCTVGSGPEKAVDGAWSNIYTDKFLFDS